MNGRERIGITLGDPAGVGPEVICKALTATPEADRAAIVVIGSGETLARAAGIVGADAGTLGTIAIEEVASDGPLPFGRLDARAGEAAFRYIARAVEMPINVSPESHFCGALGAALFARDHVASRQAPRARPAAGATDAAAPETAGVTP